MSTLEELDSTWSLGFDLGLSSGDDLGLEHDEFDHEYFPRPKNLIAFTGKYVGKLALPKSGAKSPQSYSIQRWPAP